MVLGCWVNCDSPYFSVLIAVGSAQGLFAHCWRQIVIIVFPVTTVFSPIAFVHNSITILKFGKLSVLKTF
ncbi:hypothetical protein HAX54_038186 [Datura stramonium]|uniref:Uncharacterized protein n=1 Tax=Datura stramonium TaxID=4076 RepID=A0ABS8RMS8_DATST|nr:hypothetical protein [Datura stramonium]